MNRTRLCFYLLLLIPFAVYWQTVFQDYGLRSDYVYLAQSAAEPGAMVKYTASKGRPLSGALLETSFAVAGGMDGLKWLRLASVLLLSLLGLALWRQLCQSGWSEIEATLFGLCVVCLPAAQVTAGWASCWPQVLALLLAVAGFAAVEAELERGGMKRAAALLGGVMIYSLAALIYQSNVLFAVVPIGAILLVRTERDHVSDRAWLAIHLGTLLAGLALSYWMVRLSFASGVFHESASLRFENHPFTKILWFFRHPLPNALALYALRDTFQTGAVVFWCTVAAATAIIAVGYRTSRAAKDPGQNQRWLLCLLIFPLLAGAVSLVAAERAIGYRMGFALSGLVLVLVFFSLRTLHMSGRIPAAVHFTLLGILSLVAVVTANRNALSLIAKPQASEWALIQTGALHAGFKGPVRVFLITPSLADRSTGRVYADEFGSLSSDAGPSARAMFMLALRERFFGKLPEGFSCTVTVGTAEPAPKAYDLVVDLRKLRNTRDSGGG